MMSKMVEPPQLNAIKRCRDCLSWSKGTITKPICKKLLEPRHQSHKACGAFNPGPVPVKKSIKIATFDILKPK